jgi:hypothetical protein
MPHRSIKYDSLNRQPGFPLLSFLQKKPCKKGYPLQSLAGVFKQLVDLAQSIDVMIRNTNKDLKPFNNYRSSRKGFLILEEF